MLVFVDTLTLQYFMGNIKLHHAVIYYWTKSKTCCDLLFQSVSAADITNIVDLHNEFRKDPNTTETAAMMCKMVSSDSNLPRIVKQKVKNLWHMIYLSISFDIAWDPLLIPFRFPLESWLVGDQEWIHSEPLIGLQRSHDFWGNPLARRLGGDQEWIRRGSTLTFWASDWLREITWVGGDLLPIPSQSPP